MSEPADLARALTWAAARSGPIDGVRPLSGGSTSAMLALTGPAGEDRVLRLMTNEPWRTHGAALTTRECEVQRMLAGTPVPAPRSIALDAEGDATGDPTHLMTLLPGAVDLDPDVGLLADALATVHTVEPTIEVRGYESWAWEAKYVVPPWATDPGLWESAFALLRTDPPSHEPCFLHRDFQPRNVLWDHGRVTGIVDWVETSVGPAWLDVAHCATNLAVTHGNQAAEAFARAYTARTGTEPVAYLDVMDVVGFLPPPGRASSLTDPAELDRLESRLAAAMARA